MTINIGVVETNVVQRRVAEDRLRSNPRYSVAFSASSTEGLRKALAYHKGGGTAVHVFLVGGGDEAGARAQLVEGYFPDAVLVAYSTFQSPHWGREAILKGLSSDDFLKALEEILRKHGLL